MMKSVMTLLTVFACMTIGQESFARDNTLSTDNPRYTQDLRETIGSLLAEIRELRKEVAKGRCPDSGDGEIKWQIKKCVDPLLRFLPAGTRCETSGGVEWELVSRDKDGFENWRDLSAGGKTWISGYKTGTHDSISQCEVDGKLVPTEKDFELADGHGLREVIPTIESRIFWTKTRQSEFWAKAYFGKDGRIFGHHATDSWNPASVICVQ